MYKTTKTLRALGRVAPVALAVAMTTLATAFAVRAQTTIPDSAEAAVRDGSNANVDISESTVGYCMVKYNTSGSSAKSYFKFDFTGQNPNTNNGIIFTCTTAPNSQRQQLQGRQQRRTCVLVPEQFAHHRITTRVAITISSR